jgi:cell division transport system ATP-binding protein
MIRMFNVTKRYGGHIALQGVTLEVETGEMVFVAGPSGAGKSTVIRLITAEEREFEGQILVGRQNLRRMPARLIPALRRSIGVVFQDFKLLPSRTVFQNVALRLEIDGVPSAVVGKKVRHVLKRVGLSGRENAFPLELSGGEQQRVAIARAIAGDPALVLADEPTGNLDLDLTMDILELLEEVNASGATVMMATHSRDILESRDHRVIRLEQGRVVS